MLNPFIVGQRIKTRREQLGLSQKDLALALSIDQGKVSLIEKGGRKIDCIYELYALCECLKVSADWLLMPEIDPDSPVAEKKGGEAIYPRKIEVYCNGTRGDYKAIGAELLAWGLRGRAVKELGEHGMCFVDGPKSNSPLTICVQVEPNLLRLTAYNHPQKDVLQAVLASIPEPTLEGDA